MKVRRPPRPLLLTWLALLAIAVVGLVLGATGVRAAALAGAIAGVGFIVLGVVIFATTPRS